MFTGTRFVQNEAEHRLRELLCNGAIRRHHVIIRNGKRKSSQEMYWKLEESLHYRKHF